MAESLPVDDGWDVSFVCSEPVVSFHKVIQFPKLHINWDRRVSEISSLRPGHHCRLLPCKNNGSLNLLQKIEWDDGTLWAVKSPIPNDGEDEGSSVCRSDEPLGNLALKYEIINTVILEYALSPQAHTSRTHPN